MGRDWIEGRVSSEKTSGPVCIEKIQECFNERIQMYIEKYQQNEKMLQLDNFVKY